VTLLWVGVVAVVLGGGLLVSHRPLTTWNARNADGMRSEHFGQVAQPSDGHPGHIVGVGALVLVVGVVLVVIGAVQLATPGRPMLR
jgi:hypothetical protein